MAQNTSSQNAICSIFLSIPTNHVCSFDIAQNKQCSILVCSVCKTDELGMEDTAPYRCQQHAPSSSTTSSSSFKISGNSTSTSATSTMAKASHVVSRKCMSDGNDMPGPKFAIDDTKSNHKRSLLWKFFAPFNTAFHPEMKEHRICLISHGIGIDKALKVGEKHSGQSIQQCTLIFGTL
jgi:hypothetical protein